MTVPASARHLRGLRALARAFAEDVGLNQDAIENVASAVTEACANVVLHAYGNATGPLHLRAHKRADGLVFDVVDHGTEIAQQDSERDGGLGIVLIRELCDDVHIEGPGPNGTHVRMTFHVTLST